MYQLIFIVISALFLSACSLNKAPMTEYTIHTNMQDGDLTSRGCADKSLKVSQAFSPNNLMSLKMNYAQGSYKQFAYSESQWADSPNRAITAEIIKLLRETDLFKSIQTDKSRSKNDFILETNIEDFMQYFTNDSNESYSSIVMSLSLLDSNTNTIVSTKTFNIKVQSDSLDANGGVEALNKALEDILTQVRNWLNEVCK